MAKKYRKVTKEVQRFVCEKISGGMDLATVCRKYADRLPSESAIKKAQIRDKDFFEAVSVAYDSYVQSKLAEIEKLSLEPTPKEIVESGNKQAVSAYHADKRARIDVLKFIIAKVAPMLSKRWEAIDKNKDKELSQTNIGAQYVIQNYANPEPQPIEGEVLNEKIESDNK